MALIGDHFRKSNVDIIMILPITAEATKNDSFVSVHAL